MSKENKQILTAILQFLLTKFYTYKHSNRRTILKRKAFLLKLKYVIKEMLCAENIKTNLKHHKNLLSTFKRENQYARI